MRFVLLLRATVGVGLLAAACGVSSSSKTDEPLGTVQQAVPFPTITPTVKPPSLHLEPFISNVGNAPGSYESALSVRALRLGLDGYVVVARRIEVEPKLRVRFLVYRLDARGQPIWSHPYVAPDGYILQDIREYKGPGFNGFVLAGETSSSCGASCTPNSGFLMVLDSIGFMRATSFYAPPGDGVTRLRAVNQAPDGSLFAVGETSTRGYCQRLSTTSYYKPLYQSSGFFVVQPNVLDGTGRFITTDSLATSLCPEPRKGATPTSSYLQDLTVLGDGRRVVAVGGRLNDLTNHYEALNVALAPPGTSGWLGSPAVSLLSSESYGGSRGDTHARAVARVDADSFVLAGYTSAFNSGGRTGNAGFMRRHALTSTTGFVNEWPTSDLAAGFYLSATTGWRLFGGSLGNQFDDIAASGSYAVAVGPIDQIWNSRYLSSLSTAAATDNGFMARVNVADGNDKVLSSLPHVTSLFYRRPYDAGLRGVSETVGPGFAVAGFAKLPGETSKVLLAQLDPDLSTDGSFIPPADPVPDPEPDPWAEQADMFKHKCKSCHGADHAGAGEAPCLIGVSRSCAINRISCGVKDTSMSSYCTLINFHQVEDLADYLVAYVPDAGVTCQVPPKCGNATGLPECHENLCAQ